MTSKWITQNRISQQMKSIAKQRPPHLFAAPLPDNIFVWHFTITGPQNTDFHSGVYHGEIVLPKQYPFKPPEVLFLNESGRFEPHTKICLSITQYHPETWSAGISIRMMLQAIIAIFDDKVPGIGSIEATPAVRKKLARISHHYKCQKCGMIEGILKPREPLEVTESEVGAIKELTQEIKDKRFQDFIKQLPGKQKEEQRKYKKQQEKIEQQHQQQQKKQEMKQQKLSNFKRFKSWFGM